jgi:hypothetical protein
VGDGEEAWITGWLGREGGVNLGTTSICSLAETFHGENQFPGVVGGD